MKITKFQIVVCAMFLILASLIIVVWLDKDGRAKPGAPGDYMIEGQKYTFGNIVVSSTSSFQADLHVGTQSIRATFLRLYQGNSDTWYVKNGSKTAFVNFKAMDLVANDDITMTGTNGAVISGFDDILFGISGSHNAITIYRVAGENISRGEICVQSGTTGQFVKADANIVGKSKSQVGIACDTITSGNSGYFAIFGDFDYQTWNWPDFDPVYISETAGGLTQNVVSGTGNTCRLVGYATGSDSIFIQTDISWLTQ